MSRLICVPDACIKPFNEIVKYLETGITSPDLYKSLGHVQTHFTILTDAIEQGEWHKAENHVYAMYAFMFATLYHINKHLKNHIPSLEDRIDPITGRLKY